MFQTWVVYLYRTGKYQRTVWRPSQGQKGVDERALMASPQPSPPRDVLKVGRADTRGLPGHLPVLLPTTMACSYPRWLRPWRHAKQEHFAQRPDVIGQPRGHRWGPRLPQLGRARPIGGLGLREGLAQSAMGQDEIVILLAQHQLLP